MNKVQPHSGILGKKKKKIHRVGWWGLNPGPTDYKYCAPWPLSHTAIKFENIYKGYLKKNLRFISSFSISKF